jgi:hypothetical protein
MGVLKRLSLASGSIVLRKIPGLRAFDGTGGLKIK